MKALWYWTRSSAVLRLSTYVSASFFIFSHIICIFGLSSSRLKSFSLKKVSFFSGIFHSADNRATQSALSSGLAIQFSLALAAAFFFVSGDSHLFRTAAERASLNPG
jgi:hypothetical protein